MAALDALLRTMLDQGGSDLHLTVGLPPKARISGTLRPLGDQPIDAPAMEALLKEVCPEKRWADFLDRKDLDLAHEIPGLARFRGNFLYNHWGQAAVFRQIPAKILSFSQLNLPEALKKLCHLDQGLVVVTGPTGSGKSTTLAAMIDYINDNLARHIITIEDPIEFVHPVKKSVIVHREVGEHTESFATALKGAMRHDPDILLLGEMRDYETIETALLAAETGHLVLSTLHTLDATETVNRIIAVFPPHQQKQIRIQLAAVLKSIISMRLLPRADGLGRVPAVEVLISTAYIRDCIEQKEKTKLIRDAIATGTSQYGMQTFDQSLYGLYKSGLITLDEALRRASNPDEFKLRVQGIQSTADVSREEMEGALEVATEPEAFAAGSPFEFGGKEGTGA